MGLFRCASAPVRRSTNTTMAYTWDNRVNFIVRYMYDIDNNGFLDKNDFECLAVKTTVIELGKKDWDEKAFAKNKEIMANLWNEIAEIADFNKDGEVSVDEFKKGLEMSCKGKGYADLPQAFKFFIDAYFRTIDVDGDGTDLARYQELYAQFIGETDESCSACYLFGPLT